MDQQPVPAPEQPRAEPEIIPPGEAGAPRDAARHRSSTHRLYVGRIGPLGFFLIMLAIAALAMLVLVVIVGAFLLWLPVAALLLAIAVLSGLWRGRRLR